MSYSYIRCPKCGYIALDRKLPETLLGVVQREVVCPRCLHLFRVKAKNHKEQDTSEWFQ